MTDTTTKSSKKRKSNDQEQNKNLKRKKYNPSHQNAIRTSRPWLEGERRERPREGRRNGNLVIIQDREEALAYANQAPESGEYYRIFWTDGSVRQRSPVSSPSSSSSYSPLATPSPPSPPSLSPGLPSYPPTSPRVFGSSGLLCSPSPAPSPPSPPPQLCSSSCGRGVFAGAAAVYADPPQSQRWICKGFRLEGVEKPRQAELLAIGAGIKLAVEATQGLKHEDGVRKKMVIFSDCQSALEVISDLPFDSSIAADVSNVRARGGLEPAATENLSLLHELDTQLEFRWVPAHKRVQGNMVADSTAKAAARYAERAGLVSSAFPNVCMVEVPSPLIFKS